MSSRGGIDIDVALRSMTAGAPSRGFTARVMAPIHGRPRPDFTARVMQRIEAAASARGPHRRRAVTVRNFGAGLMLVPATLMVAAGVAIFRASRVTMPDALARPALVSTNAPRTPIATLPAAPSQAPSGAAHVTRVRRTQPPAIVREAAAIYTIAALDGPAKIGLPPIASSTPAVLPLAGPAALKVTDLPGAHAGSRDQNFKERP